MSKIPAINEIDANSPSQESTEVVVKATTVTPDINEIQETISASATIQEIDGTRKPTISEIYKIVNDGLFESTTNWWDYAYKLSQAQINQDIISRLDNGVIGGGYSKGVDIITTTSNKVPSNTNVYSALKSDSLYPKKLNDEVINGIYDFLNGLTIGKPTAYTGGTWSVDQTGRTHLTTDYLYVRLKAIFETLQILNVDTIGGKLVISPAGSIRVAYVDRIKIDAPVFIHNEETDVWSISQVEDAEGNLVNETLNQEVYRCYFLGEQDGEEVENKWKVGDQAQAKTFNVKKGTYHKVENSYLWRLVVNVSSDTVDIDGKKYHYVDLSQIDFDSGSDAPAPGDILNQLGHRLNDAQRQTALVLNAVDNYAPSITLYAGVNYYTFLNKEYVEFGVYNGKAFFNVYGDMYIGDKGTNPKTYIKYKNGKINIKANLEIGSSIGDKDLDQYIKENGGVDEETVKNLINNAQVIKDLQKQTDGAIETWFYEGVPTPNNYPSTDKENKGDVLTYNIPGIDWYNEDINNYNAIKDSDKYTEAEKEAIKVKARERHIGDLYYDQKTGYAYRFTRYDDDIKPYRWNVISDSELTKILEAANKAQATADGKMKVFYGETKPTNYQVGDMWVNATLEGKFNNDIARAVAKSESFNADDWVLASRYSEAIATIQKWTNEYETKFGILAEDVKNQKDQSIIVWYLEYEPTIDNAPANKWNTETLRSEHIGDIVYDIKNNHSYRWTGSAWVQIKDADFNEAMKAAKAADDKAGAAGDLADSKRRIFYSDTTPTKPFDKGDLWIKQVKGKTETWVYNGTDWVKSEDKDLADFSAAINDELTGIKGQIDGKAETWYQNTNPRNEKTGVWESGGTDKSHKGDIWYNTKDGTTNYWNGSAWEQMDIPKDVFDTIDGKSSIFVDSYADAKAGTGVINKGYKERDLWILPADATVNGIKYYKGDMLTAVSNNKNFDETNWEKKVRYVGPTELNKAIDIVNDKINTINNTTIPGINNKFNEFVKDGVLDSSEKARLTDLLNQANNEVAAVIDQVNNIIKSKYLTNDNANKGKLEEANTVMNTAWTEYETFINTLIDADTEITKVNIGEANTKYKNLQEKIKAVKQYLAICQADVLSGMGTDISSYKYLKDALNQTTEINGGLVLTSAIQLKDVDKKVTAGMNGIVKGDKSSIAAWYGGPMVDRDTFTKEQLETKVAGTDYAMSLLRHDGTGYLAGGNIHWDAKGVLTGNFNSFILQSVNIAAMFFYIRLFYLHSHIQDTTKFENIDYVTPMKPFSRLSVQSLGGTEGGNSLPTGLFIGDSKTGGSFQIGNVILRTKSGDPNILEIVSADSKKTAHLGVQGGVSAYGTYTPSTGGGGGLNGTIIPYATAIASDPQNEGSKIASASSIYKLHSRISAIENNGATSITVSGTGNAITSVSKNGTSITFTKGATFLTSHQSLANYYTKSSVDSLLSGKSATSHTHSVKINGVTKTIAATGGTAVDLGTYLTSHQSLNGYATQSWVKSQGYLTSHQDVSVLTMAEDRYYKFGQYGINMKNSDIIGVNSIYTNDVSETHCEAILFCRSNNNYDGIRAVDGVLYFSDNVVRTTEECDAEYKVYHTGNLTKLSQLTNDKNFVTGSVSGQTITINGVSTTWQNTWRGITDSYSGTSTGTSLSQKGANSLYNALHNGYASSAGNADTVDGYHVNGSNVAPYGHIPSIENDGVMEVGKCIDFHNDNSGEHDFSTRLQTTGNYGNSVYLPSHNGTLALISDNVASATKLQTPRTIWGQSFDGTGNIDGNLTITNSGSFQIGNVILRTKSGDPNILEIVSADSKKTAHLGVQGGVSAYGTYTPSTGGGGGLNGTIIPYATAIASDPQNEGSKIASASSIYKLHSRISAIENNGATSITVSGTGNAITSVSKNGTSITFTKGATFLTSHQSLANYYTKSSVDSLLSGKSATSHTHSVKINGVTKTIAATGGTAVDLGTYLTSHQSLNGYATQSWVKSQGYLTSHQDVSVLTMAEDRYYKFGQYGINMKNSDIIGVNSIYTNDVSETHCEAILFCRSNNNYDGIRAVDGVLYFSDNVVRTTEECDAEYKVYHTGNLTKLSQLTNDKNFVTGSVSGQTITINGVSTTWQNTWRGITDSYSGTSTGTSLSQKGANSLYNALHNGYASSAGNADTVDGYHVNGSNVAPYGHIPSIENDGVMEVGKCIDFHNDNSGEHDFSTRLQTTGNYGNSVYLPSHNGTLALISDNVASATKLQTPRTIWGQSFDGTGNIDGNLTITNSGSDDPHIISTAAKWFHIVSKYKLVLYVGEYNCTQMDAINILSNHNVGIGVNPSYKLHVRGDIYSSATIRTAAQNKAIMLTNDSNPAWISALEGQVIFNTGKAIRFGETDWDWNKWAGLKYTHSNKTIYLGIADGSAFTGNSAQSNGRLRLAGITTITPDSGARIGGSGGDLYLGNGNNSNWVKVQNMCSQASSDYWKITQSGNASFKSLNVDNAIACGSITINGGTHINGDTHINGLLTAKATMFTTADSNVYGTSLQNWDGSIGANVTNMFNGIDMDNIQVEYSMDNGASWNTYPGDPENRFNLVNDNADIFNYFLGCNNLLGNTDADKLTQIKKNQLRVTVKVPDEVYQELSWISVDVTNGVNIKCQVYFGNSSGVYTEYTSKVMTGWSHKCDICVGPLNVNVGNDVYRYVRLVFSHPSNNTNLRNGIVNKIRALALTKYFFSGGRYTITTTGHIYNYDAYMNTYFPNSILAKGGVTAYQSSDVRLKTNITKLNCLKVIKSIGGTYEFDYIRDHKHSIGFIAQNVNNPLLNDIVAKDDNGYLKINYWNPKLISLAFGALTEIDDEVDKLKARVRELENEVEYLKNKNYVLQ